MRFLTTIEVINEFTALDPLNANYELGIKIGNGEQMFTFTPSQLDGKTKDGIADIIYNGLISFFNNDVIGNVLVESYLDVFRVNNKIFIYSQSEGFTYQLYVSGLYGATIQEEIDAYNGVKNILKNDDGNTNGIFRGVEVLDLNVTSHQTISIPQSPSGGCLVGVYVEFDEIHPAFLNNTVNYVIKSFLSDDVIVTNTVIGNDTIIAKVERGLGVYSEFIITDYMDKTHNFKTYIPSKLLDEDFEFELKKVCNNYILTVKRNKHDLVLSYSYGSGASDTFVLNNNIKHLPLSTDLDSNIIVSIKDEFGCRIDVDLILRDIYIEKEDFYFISSENSIRYVADKLVGDCCFDKEDDVKMNEFYFNDINIRACQLFTECDNITTQVLSNIQPVYKKTNLDGFVVENDIPLIINNSCVNLDANVLKTENEYLFGINTGVKTLKIFLKDYIDNLGDTISIVNGVPSLFLNKEINLNITYTKLELVGANYIEVTTNGSFNIFLDNIKFDNISGFYIELSFDFENIININYLNAIGDLEDYNVYEFTINMANTKNVSVLIGGNTIISDDLSVIEKTKNLVKITYWSDEDTTLKNTSILGVVNLKAINKTISSDINKETVFLDESINNSNIKTYHKQTIKFEPIKIQLFENLIDAISNKFLTVNDVPMTYESHTSKVLGDTDLIEFSLTFYIDHKRGIKSKSIINGDCGVYLDLNYNKDNSPYLAKTNNNFNIKINTND